MQRIPVRGLRRQIARNMTQAARVPVGTDYREVDGTRLLTARRTVAAAAPEDVRVTFVAFVVRAVASVLRRHDSYNASFDEEREEIVLYENVNVGIAAATPDGVIVPVIHHADRKSIVEIAREADELGALARERRLTAGQLAGGTFTVNNTGALDPKGGTFPTPLLNWPQAAILGFGRIADRVVAIDGTPAVRPTMLLTVSADHRLIDGDELVAFSDDLVALLEEPDLLLGELR